MGKIKLPIAKTSALQAPISKRTIPAANWMFRGAPPKRSRSSRLKRQAWTERHMTEFGCKPQYSKSSLDSLAAVSVLFSYTRVGSSQATLGQPDDLPGLQIRLSRPGSMMGSRPRMADRILKHGGQFRASSIHWNVRVMWRSLTSSGSGFLTLLCHANDRTSKKCRRFATVEQGQVLVLSFPGSDRGGNLYLRLVAPPTESLSFSSTDRG